MARIYISYSHADKALINPLAEGLRKRGHELLMDTEVMKIGQDFRKTLLTALKSSDGVLVFVTEQSSKSNYVISEIGAARAFVDESANKRFLIPVLYGNIEIPNIIQDIYCIRLSNDNYDEAINLIDQSISKYYGRKEAVEEKESSQREKIESKAADYVEVAITALKKREFRNTVVGTIWYILGFSTLFGGVWFAVNGLRGLDNLINQNFWMYVLVILKSIIIVGLLIACSKYAFNLGKSFINEALRNADRLHAIAFGKFYLQAFGDRISSPEEIKEVFQNWNIDKDSAFQKLDTNSYDPKFNESLVEIIKNLSEKVKK
jgi:hypothetical protein